MTEQVSTSASTMRGTQGQDGDLEALAQKIVQKFKETPDDQRLLVSISGIPGSGKSTLAYPLTDRINALLLQHPAPHPSHPVSEGAALAKPDTEQGSGDEVAICVGLDGWHFSREKLDAFEDPREAHWRRGAPFTFDFASYLTFLQLLRLPLLPSPPIAIPFPTFDHALKDPRPSIVPITPRHRIILLEGLYCLLSLPGWRDAAQMFDMRIWVEVEYNVARDRVIKRNFEAGIVDDIDRCAERADAVDMVNAKLILENKVEPTDIVRPVNRTVV